MTTHDHPRDVRVGLIGYGLAGAVFHAPLIAATPGMRLTAVVTRDPERQARVRRDHPHAHVVDVPEQLWAPAAAPAAVDLVVVASPNGTHVPLAAAAVAAGRHVVVDKPFALTAAQGRAVAAQARERGVVLAPFHNRRWDGDFRTVRRLVAEGALGTVARFESRFERWRPVPRAGWKERAEPGTGILYDLGPHLVDQALVLFGPVTHVYAELNRRRAGDPAVDDDAFVALTHASGVRSQLWASAVAAQPGPRFRVLGSHAAYTKRGLDPQEAGLAAGARPGQPGWGADPRDHWGLLGIDGGTGDDAPRAVPTEAGAYEQFYAGVLAAVRGAGSPPVAPDDAVAGLVVIEAARQSAAERRVVHLDAAAGVASTKSLTG